MGGGPKKVMGVLKKVSFEGPGWSGLVWSWEIYARQAGQGGSHSPNLPYSKGVGSPVAALPLAVSSWSGRSLWSVEWELHKISL